MIVKNILLITVCKYGDLSMIDAWFFPWFTLFLQEWLTLTLTEVTGEHKWISKKMVLRVVQRAVYHTLYTVYSQARSSLSTVLFLSCKIGTDKIPTGGYSSISNETVECSKSVSNLGLWGFNQLIPWEKERGQMNYSSMINHPALRWLRQEWSICHFLMKRFAHVLFSFMFSNLKRTQTLIAKTGYITWLSWADENRSTI